MRVKLQDLLRQGEIVLKERKIEQYRSNAYCLLHKHFNVSRAPGAALAGAGLSGSAGFGLLGGYPRPRERRPLQHLLGSWEFMGLSLL